MDDRRSRKQRFGGALWHLAEIEAAAAGRRSFRAKPYSEAVWALDALSDELDEDRASMTAVAGIGPGVASLIEEYRYSGRLSRLERLRADFPSESGRLRRLPRMTASKLRWLKAELGVEDVSGLAAALDTSPFAAMPGVGPGTVEVWRQRLDAAFREGMPTYRATVYGQRWARHLQAGVPDVEAEVTGAIRRLDEHVDAVEIVVAGCDPEGFLARSALVQAPPDQERGKLSLTTLGGRVLVHRARPSNFGTVLVRSTGPIDHVDRLVEVAGSLPEAGTEEEVYARLGLAFVPPPARRGDLEDRHLPLPATLGVTSTSTATGLQTGASRWSRSSPAPPPTGSTTWRSPTTPSVSVSAA